MRPQDEESAKGNYQGTKEGETTKYTDCTKSRQEPRIEHC